VLLGVAAMVGLVGMSAGEPWRVVAFSLYGASLILLYSTSSIYHWLEVSPPREEWLRRIDHVAIYLLIAGTYTPICLVTLRGAWGWSLFGIVWGMAISGTVMKLFFRELPRSVYTALYVGMGWLAVVAVVPLVRAFPVAGLAWMLAGGLAYTAGAVVYAVRRPDPFPRVFGFHEIFHVMVLAGSVAHFVFLLRYVAPVL
jgi:hemolysin III